MRSIKMPANNFTAVEIDTESEQLFCRLQHVDCEPDWQWNDDACRRIAPLTLEIHRLKMEKNAVILLELHEDIQPFYRDCRPTRDLIELRYAAQTALLVVHAAGLNPVSRGCHWVSDEV